MEDKKEKEFEYFRMTDEDKKAVDDMMEQVHLSMWEWSAFFGFHSEGLFKNDELEKKMTLYIAIYKQDNKEHRFEIKADSELEAKQLFWKHFKYSDGISLVNVVKY